MSSEINTYDGEIVVSTGEVLANNPSDPCCCDTPGGGGQCVWYRFRPCGNPQCPPPSPEFLWVCVRAPNPPPVLGQSRFVYRYLRCYTWDGTPGVANNPGEEIGSTSAIIAQGCGHTTCNQNYCEQYMLMRPCSGGAGVLYVPMSSFTDPRFSVALGPVPAPGIPPCWCPQGTLTAIPPPNVPVGGLVRYFNCCHCRWSFQDPQCAGEFASLIPASSCCCGTLAGLIVNSFSGNCGGTLQFTFRVRSTSVRPNGGAVEAVIDLVDVNNRVIMVATVLMGCKPAQTFSATYSCPLPPGFERDFVLGSFPRIGASQTPQSCTRFVYNAVTSQGSLINFSADLEAFAGGCLSCGPGGLFLQDQVLGRRRPSLLELLPAGGP